MHTIDLEKLICSKIKYAIDNNMYYDFEQYKYALAEQGLKYENGKIVEIENKLKEVVKGNWYICIAEYDGISEGELCYSPENNKLFESSHSGISHYIDSNGLSYFRLATDEDKIQKHSFEIGDHVEYLGKELTIYDMSVKRNFYKLINDAGDISVASANVFEPNARLIK